MSQEEIDEVFEKHIEKYKNMSEEEVKEHLRKGYMKKYDRLNYAFVRIDMLLDYIRVLKEHKTELQSPGSRVVVASGKKFNPVMLSEYVVLEITSFYNLVRQIKEEEQISDLPDNPDYWPIIRDFRNQITSHLDKEGRFQTTAEWMDQYNKVDEIGIDKIVNQFKKDYYQCYKLLKENM